MQRLAKPHHRPFGTQPDFTLTNIRTGNLLPTVPMDS